MAQIKKDVEFDVWELTGSTVWRQGHTLDLVQAITDLIVKHVNDKLEHAASNIEIDNPEMELEDLADEIRKLKIEGELP